MMAAKPEDDQTLALRNNPKAEIKVDDASMATMPPTSASEVSMGPEHKKALDQIAEDFGSETIAPLQKASTGTEPDVTLGAAPSRKSLDDSTINLNTSGSVNDPNGTTLPLSGKPAEYDPSSATMPPSGGSSYDPNSATMPPSGGSVFDPNGATMPPSGGSSYDPNNATMPPSMGSSYDPNGATMAPGQESKTGNTAVNVGSIKPNTGAKISQMFQATTFWENLGVAAWVLSTVPNKGAWGVWSPLR